MLIDYLKKNWPIVIMAILLSALLNLATDINIFTDWLTNIEVWLNLLIWDLFLYQVMTVLTFWIKNQYLQHLISLLFTVTIAQIIVFEFDFSEINSNRINLLISGILVTLSIMYQGFQSGTKKGMKLAEKTIVEYHKQISEFSDDYLDYLLMKNESLIKEFKDDKQLFNYFFKVDLNFVESFNSDIKNEIDKRRLNNMLSVEEFKEKFEIIKSMGYVKSHRLGNTGVGKTFEDLLGITENNIKGPDFGVYEIKSTRKTSKSLVTLTTQKPSLGDIETLRRDVGYPQTKNNITINCLRQTLDLNIIYTNSINRKSIQLKFDESDGNKLVLYSGNTKLEPEWYVSDIVQNVKNKLSNVVYVEAERKKINGEEFFHYVSAKLLKLKDNAEELLIQAIKDNTLKLDIRLGQHSNGLKHDHGTGFRIKKDNLWKLFDITVLI